MDTIFYSAKINVMISSKSGFTIVELLIVIVVIGILASITVVGFNGIQDRATTTAQSMELRAWEKSYEAYRALNGTYPTVAVPSRDYCLGTGFPRRSSDNTARCREYNNTWDAVSFAESDSADLMNQLRSVGSLPSGPRVAVDGTVGPYVSYNLDPAEIVLMAIIKGDDTTCQRLNLIRYDGYPAVKKQLCAIKLEL